VTEQATEERTATSPEAPRCRYGIETPEPCPRVATEWTDYSRDAAEPTVCAEHAAALRISREEDDWLEAEHYLQKFIQRAYKQTGGKSALVRVLQGAMREVEQGKHDLYQRIEAAHAVAGCYKDDSHKA
jgi:hypothetical protein